MSSRAKAALALACALVALAASGAAAGVASAATAGFGGSSLSYSAAAGEANVVTVSYASGFYTVRDTGAAIAPGAGCSAQTANQVRCSATGVKSLAVTLGDGDDTYTQSSGTAATVSGGPGADHLTTNAGGDTLRGDEDNDTLSAGGGNDTLDGGTGPDSLDGGSGTGDAVSYASRTGPVQASVDGAANDGEAGEGDDVMTSVDKVVGGDADDTLTGAATAVTLSGGPGADQLAGGSANDTLDGGTGADVLEGGDGVDTATYVGRTTAVRASIDGSANDGADANADGNAEEGDDVRPSVESLTGGTGADTLTGSDGANALNGGGGNDVLRGLGGGDTLVGGSAGDDTLDGGTGPDTLDGGTGTDTATYATRTAGVTADPDGAADDGESGEGDNVLATVESLSGGAGDDALTGSSGANVLTGNGGVDALAGAGGADTLSGGDASDSLDGGDASDSLDGGLGADSIAGGAGVDTVTYASRTTAVRVTLDGVGDDGGDASADGVAEEGDDVDSDVENVTGGRGNDVLAGSESANSLSGGDGDDTLTGAGGADTLSGGNGDDRLDGGAAADTMSGGAGVDRLSYAGRTSGVHVTLDAVADDGEAGEGDRADATVENVTGGSGDDTLTGSSAANYLNGGAGVDAVDGAGGNDLIGARDGSADGTLACGTGTDFVTHDPSDSPAADCERQIAPAVGEPVVAAAGDVACAPALVSSTTVCRQLATAEAIEALAPDALAVLGDIQYENGTAAEFASYDRSWGRFAAIDHPAPGNHEYNTPEATGYYGYFGSAAGDPTRGYYSYDVGSWHVLALNSNCSFVSCAAGSAQEQWLRADLAAHPSTCTLAYWHHPRFSSGGHGDNPVTAPLWQALQDGGADLVLTSHDHDYERFAAMAPDGQPAPAGMRSFVVGTGGRSHSPFLFPKPGSELRDASTFGVLALTLHASGYDWRFLPEAGKTFTDAGSAPCH